MNLIIQNTKAILESRGLKQKTFAQKAGYSEQQLSRKLAGHSPITWEDVLKIANALELTPNDLYGISVEEKVSDLGEPELKDGDML